MIAFLGRLLAPFAIKIVAGLAIAGAVAAVLLGAKRAGRNEERAARLQEATEVKDEQLKAALNRPADRDDLKRRMLSDRF